MSLTRREVHFSGRVQGVGFRYTTNRLARRYPVSGFVENLGDGRVHLIVEGATKEIDAFLRDLHETMQNNIQHTQSLDSNYLGEFTDFGIRR